MEDSVNVRHIRRKILRAALSILEQEGFVTGLLKKATALAGYAEQAPARFFDTDEDLILNIYLSLASELETTAAEIPAGTVAERFTGFMRAKFSILEAHRHALLSLASSASKPTSDLAVFSKQTELVRVKVMSSLHAVVGDSSDGLLEVDDELVELLYLSHLGLVWLWTRDTTPGFSRTNRALRWFEGTFRTAFRAAPRPVGRCAVRMLAAAARPALKVSDQEAGKVVARDVFTKILPFRRLIPGSPCQDVPCRSCFSGHVVRGAFFVRRNEPIHIILPGFPAKSPSRKKTLGPLPDQAEEQALLFLAELCAAARSVYPPGLRITICSDGHAFADVVGVTDQDVDLYANELTKILGLIGEPNITLFSLRDAYEGEGTETLRLQLLEDYATPLEILRRQAEGETASKRLLDGVHRFLFEEQRELKKDSSRSALQRETRTAAYHVVQRSHAWARLLADLFPTALRFSIHPQSPHGDKIGIHLGTVSDVWLTPWHGVAVLTRSGWRFMKVHEAEEAGYHLVYKQGRPYYYDARPLEETTP